MHLCSMVNIEADSLSLSLTHYLSFLLTHSHIRTCQPDMRKWNTEMEKKRLHDMQMQPN